MTTVIIDDCNPQADQLLNYIRVLPFATVEREKTKSIWDTAIEEGAVSVDEFFDELDALIEKWPNHA